MKIVCLLVGRSGGRGPGLEEYGLSQLSHPGCVTVALPASLRCFAPRLGLFRKQAADPLSTDPGRGHQLRFLELPVQHGSRKLFVVI